ncbi:MAG: amidohydrolase family protein [Bryobacteraceae bacterium]|nr:amidohydrolase family protein [Bryobacteraceae bacterium]
MMRLAGTLLALCALVHAQSVRPNYAITNAKVVTTPGKTLDSATILVRDGLIENVGPNLAIPPDARVYDAKGLTIYPGLIDAATNYGFAPPVRTLAPVAAPIAIPGVSLIPEDVASPDKYLRPQASGVNPDFSAAQKLVVPTVADPRRAYGFTTVLSVPREGHWQGTSALVNLAPGPANEAVVMSPVAMHVNFATSFSFASGLAPRYPSSLMGVFAVLRQSLIKAQQYREMQGIYESAGRSGVPRPAFDANSEALLPVLDGKVPVMFAADSAEQIHRAIRFADEFKLKPLILGGAEAWKVADMLKARNIPVLVSLSLAAPSAGRSMFASGPEAEAPVNSPGRIAAEENPGKLEKAGVRWAFASGSWERPDQIREKLRAAIQRGLSADAALRALTTYPAEILGAGAQLGSIEKGKIANLALAEGDLLGQRTRMRAVMIDGQLYFAPPQAPGGGRGALVSSRGAAPADAPQQPTTGDDPSPATPGAAKPADTNASPLPERRPPTPEPAPRDLVIRNATILTITKGTINNGSIWLHDGKIQEVGATVKAPADAKIIDGSGRFVMPGIIDSHSHSATSGGVNESGPSVTAQVRIADVINPEDVNLYRAAAAGVTTLNILHGSANAIGGQNATVKMKWGASAEQMLFPGAPRGIKMALGENPKRSNSSQTRGVRFPATRMGVESVIRETFKAGKEYKRQWEEYDAKVARREKAMPPERNLTLDAIGDVLDGKILVHAHCYRADEISMLLDMADEYGFKIRSLQHVLEGYKVTDKIKKHGAGASTFADNWGYKMEAFDGTAYNTAMMVKAGVRTAINSDSDERARRLYHEAAKAMKYGGVTEDQALRLITTEPAWMLGIDKRVGALEPGMDADIAVFNAHPLSAYARVEMTLVDGQIIFDRERDLKMRVPWSPEFESNTDTPTSGGFDEEDDH